MADPRMAVVAEDDADTRDLIHMVLAQSGFQVVLADDGPAAIEAVRLHNPLLTTLDVNMPGMDGFAVAKVLREFSHTYLIMITSLTEEIDIIRGFEAGADDYLVKPFRPRELRARADSMLRRASYAPGALPPGTDAPVFAIEEPEPEPQAESWAAAAARELRDTMGPGAVSHPPAPVAPAPAVSAPAPAPSPAQPYVGKRVRPAEPAPPAPAAAPAPAVAAAHHHAHAAEPMVTGAVIRFADLTVDTTNGVAALAGRALELTPPEAEILLSLLRTGRRVRSKADLVLAIRGQQYVTSYFVNEADKRAVEVHVASLRRKLGDDGPTPRYVETVRGVGYRMAEGG